MIQVTKTFLPPIEEYSALLQGIWDRAWVTNNGQLLQELELQLKTFLGVQNLLFTSNGTIPLQLALKGLNLHNAEIITTPFSYVATTNAILWENCRPVFVDIQTADFNIDASLIEAKITNKTKAIMATHVYGFPCHVTEIERIAQKHNLYVIYDAAHAFGVKLNGQSLLNYGHISTCSFHATKVFHTVEGGAIIVKDNLLNEKTYWQRQFGHKGDDYRYVGINAKNSEMHAAMGLCVLPHLKDIIQHRKQISQQYNNGLNFTKLYQPKSIFEIEYNYAYYPVLFQTESALTKVFDALATENIVPRRYFYPSLNTLPFIENAASCPVAEDISKRVLCLPLYFGLETDIVAQIIQIINKNI
jgi:dTDP-4-amino-4,6-dideoxygalactose transaminase